LLSSRPVARKLATRVRPGALQTEGALVVSDLATLQSALDACRANGQEAPLIVLRPSSLAEGPLEVGEVRLDQQSHLLRCGERESLLRSKPVAVLAALMRNAGRVMSREALIQQVWGEFRAEHDATLRVYVHQLRQIVDAESPQRRHILTVRSSGHRGGYVFRA
jgi:DNA-binding response OmpR family regulator